MKIMQERKLYNKVWWFWSSAVLCIGVSMVAAILGYLSVSHLFSVLSCAPMPIWIAVAVSELRAHRRSRFMAFLLVALSVAEMLILLFVFNMGVLSSAGVILYLVCYFVLIGALVQAILAQSNRAESPVLLFLLIFFWPLSAFDLKRKIDGLLVREALPDGLPPV
ncbi:MAG: hypothetical protein V7741_12445 [Hyphomonas sp.]